MTTATFMAIVTFSPETDLPQMNAVIEEEIVQVRVLTAAGRLGAVHISPARGRAFLEVRGENELAALNTVKSLPMAKWWQIELFPTMTPSTQEGPTS